MRYFVFYCATTAVAVTLVWGCSWPGHDGPIPRSLATCRQLSQRGVAAAERGQHTEAERLLAEAVKACPVDADARRHFAEALWNRGAQDRAIAQLEEAIQLANEDAMLHVRLAEMYLASGQMSRAGHSAEQALDINPRLPAAWAIRGRVTRAAGELQQALTDFHRALGYAPEDRRTLLEVAELYRELNEPQRALATLHILAETYSPGEEPQEVLYLAGLAYLALGRCEDAVESLSAAAIRDTPTAEVFYRLGEAELLAGRTAEAATAARQALSLQPGHQPSRELLGRIRTAWQAQGLPLR